MTTFQTEEEKLKLALDTLGLKEDEELTRSKVAK